MDEQEAEELNAQWGDSAYILEDEDLPTSVELEELIGRLTCTL